MELGKIQRTGFVGLAMATVILVQEAQHLVSLALIQIFLRVLLVLTLAQQENMDGLQIEPVKTAIQAATHVQEMLITTAFPVYHQTFFTQTHV